MLAEMQGLSSLLRGVGEDVCGPHGKRDDHHDLQGLDGLSAMARSRKVYESLKMHFSAEEAEDLTSLIGPPCPGETTLHAPNSGFILAPLYKSGRSKTLQTRLC